jgi:hypothetical protein
MSVRMVTMPVAAGVLAVVGSGTIAPAIITVTIDLNV